MIKIVVNKNLTNLQIIIQLAKYFRVNFLECIRLLHLKVKNAALAKIAWSAGSMNCADIVYAGPEFEGEAVDPLYERWITGLGITNINVFPHFQSLKDEYLDGLRLIEDISLLRLARFMWLTTGISEKISLTMHTTTASPTCFLPTT